LPLQSIFLLAAALINLTLLFLPSASYTANGVTENFSLLLPKGTVTTTGAFSVAVILNGACLIVALAAIFMFRQRSRQRLQCFILMAVEAVIAGLLIAMPLLKDVACEKGVAVYLPVLAAIFAFLAAHFIKKDIELLKSADRIR
jgi:hypothetical protein